MSTALGVAAAGHPVSSADNADGNRTLAAGRRVLAVEAEALKRIESALDGRFVDAVRCLLTTKGRVALTGMGKSGHIARKIAATLASTGTPAFFVHPGEASHGDLGMLTGGDTVIALSNSGETPELSDILTYTRRFGLPLIALVGRAPSSLADAADIALVLPPLEEACPMGLAPTTSTTAMLAIGDALASAALEAKGFERADFAVFHPGGKLGSRLVRVRDIMHGADTAPFIAPTAPMREAIVAISGGRLGCVGVVEAGRLSGVITDGDLRRNLGRDNFLDLPVSAVMTPGPRTIFSGALAAEALAAMTDRQPPVTQLFVVDEGGAAVGVIHLHDCLKAGVA